MQAPSELEENEISLEIEEMVENNSTPFKSTVDVEGKEKHKAINESGSSADRLRRVRTYSKFISDENELTLPDDLELDNMIMLGDKVCGKMTQGGSACLAISQKSAEKSTKSSPCTNRPITCEHCKTVQWSYNLPKHCKEKHSDYPIPTTITDEENKLLGQGVE